LRYEKVGKSNLMVSVVGLGTWGMGGDYWGKKSDSESIKTINKAIDAGINLIDTAPAYGNGHAEEVIGKAIKTRREDVIIATKCGILRERENFKNNLRPESIRKEVENSLSRLGIDVIDLYQIHWPDPDTPIEKTLDELNRLQKAGKFKYLGVSNFNVELLSKALDHHPKCNIISLESQYSILVRDIEVEMLPFCKERNIGILSYGTLGGGILSGKFKKPPKFKKGDRRSEFYPFYKEVYWNKAMDLVKLLKKIANDHNRPIVQVAINWSNQQEGITTALVGASTPLQAEINAGAGEWKLSEEDISIINSSQKIF